LAKMLAGTYHTGRFYFYLAVPGLFVVLWRELKQVRSAGIGSLRQSTPGHAIIIAPGVYFLFCAVDIQGGADLIPILPFVAVFAAVALVFIVEQAASLIARARPAVAQKPPFDQEPQFDQEPRFDQESIEVWGSALVCALILALAVSDSISTEREFTLGDQDARVREIVSHLQPGDKVFVHGQTEILVLSGLTNASKYFLLDRGKDKYLDQIEEGGFDGWLARLKAERPRVVVLDRLKSLGYLNELQTWVESEYEPREDGIFKYYLRKGY
jgi:hypothetical protein